MYMEPSHFLRHLCSASYYSKIMVTVISVSTPFMEVISGGHNLKAYLYLRENIMLAGFWDLKNTPTKTPTPPPPTLNNTICLL